MEGDKIYARIMWAEEMESKQKELISLVDTKCTNNKHNEYGWVVVRKRVDGGDYLCCC